MTLPAVPSGSCVPTVDVEVEVEVDVDVDIDVVGHQKGKDDEHVQGEG